jgi:ribulose-phosphate 3-epimerase
MVRISASLLAADHARFGEAVQRATAAGVDAFHFDMMDGHYVANLSFSPQHLADLRGETDLPFHLHLELENPDRVLSDFPPLGADMILVQWDTLAEPAETFKRIRGLGARVGLSLNPEEPLSVLEGWLSALDELLLLSVHPGFGGQPMLPGVMDRIARARRMIADEAPGLPLALDGGIGLESGIDFARAGVDWLVIGTALFTSPDMGEFVRDLKSGALAEGPNQ